MKKLVSILLAATLLLSLCALTACGKKTEEPTPAEETAEIGAFTTITEGVLTMSTESAFPPYEMRQDDGTFIGIDIEIAQAIADKLGLKLQIDDMDFDSALMAVQQGKSDIIMAGVTVTPERQEVMEFSEPYATGVQVVVVPENSDITLEKLPELTIGTQRGTTGNLYCVDDFGEDHVVVFDNGITAIQALLNGQIDCFVNDSGPAMEYVAANPGLMILPTEYVVEDYAIGLGKGNLALLDAVNAALRELKEDGTVQSILDKYLTAG